MTRTVTPLCAGTISVDRSVLVAGTDRGTTVDAPSLVFLVEGDADGGSGDLVLVDTGFGDPGAAAERHPTMAPRRDADQSLPALLDGQGYDPADVDAVVLTHLHWDHCYDLDLFPDAAVYVQRAELAYAAAPYPMHAGGYDAPTAGRTPPWLAVGENLVPVDGEREILPGVTVFPTPGHAVGHQSVAVETGDGTTVVAGDAVPTFENVTADRSAPEAPGLAPNVFDWWESAQAVLDRADRLLPGHEWSLVDGGPGERVAGGGPE